MAIQNAHKYCKYFSQAQLSYNHLVINALQNLLFCIPKAAVLHGKSVGFALQNSRFRNAKPKLRFFVGIIFTIYCCIAFRTYTLEMPYLTL